MTFVAKCTKSHYIFPKNSSSPNNFENLGLQSSFSKDKKKGQRSPLNKNLKTKYLKLRSQLPGDLCDAKYSYFERSFKNCSDHSEIWKILNNKVPEHKCSATILPSKPVVFQNPDDFITGDLQIVYELNTYFSCIGKRLASALPNFD